ncbi:Mg-chelatase subunit ChlD [Enterobacter hormaechei]|uniref:VWA domain-containing protein n=1 Tax=Enterobacter hormaechei TaxID=158836 RepID=UPI0012583383|nr:VWA domain-containing protein [Enterobacter hormaechei]VAE21272.1 Mg-chelatase subunit ChlD [Enterobacter hormaechei]VAE26927.1 Mg-chelatase subunit ChlD [Enterobacter hormaechei]
MKLDIRNDHRHLQRLHNIANVISGISDIKVIIDKNAQGPYFLPKHDLIVLPNGDFSDKEFSALCFGFICHEAGHGRYTNSDAWDDACKKIIEMSQGFIKWDNESPLFGSGTDYIRAMAKSQRMSGFINIFDDIQMEMHTGTDFQRAREGLAEMYTIMCRNGRMTNDINGVNQNPVDFIDMYILNKLRTGYLQQVGAPEKLEPFFEHAAKIFGPVKPEVDALIEEATGINSTFQAIDLAKKLYSLIERLRDEAREKQQEQQQQLDRERDTDGDAEGEPESDAEGESDGDAEGEPESDAEGESDGDAGGQSGSDDEGESDGDAQGQSEGPEGDTPASGEPSNPQDTTSVSNSDQTSGKSNFSPEEWEALADMLDAFLDSQEISKDYHDSVAAVITDVSQAASEQDKETYGGDQWSIPDINIDLNVYNEVRMLSRSINGIFSALEVRQCRGKTKTRERGVSFDNRRLPQAAFGVRDIFRTPGEDKRRGHTGLVIVRDISASMEDSDAYEMAIKSDLALSLAAQSFPKLHVANILYPFVEENFKIIKSFTQTVEETLSQFGYGKKGGSTPTGSALQEAFTLLSNCEFDRKVIFLITDGRPSQENISIEDVLQKVSNAGIEVAGIGIKTDKIKDFKDSQFVVVNDIAELTNSFRDLVYNVLS